MTSLSPPPDLISIDVRAARTIVSLTAGQKRGCKTITGETMQHFKFDMRAWTQLASLLAATSLFSADAIAAKMTGDPAATCSGLVRTDR